MAQNFLGALRAQSEGQGNLSMHPQGDNLYGYGPTTHFLAYFRLVLGATNTPPAPRFRPVLGLAAPAAPFGSFGTFRDLGSPEPQNMPWHVLGILADRPPRRPTFRPRGPLCLASRLSSNHVQFLSCMNQPLWVCFSVVCSVFYVILRSLCFFGRIRSDRRKASRGSANQNGAGSQRHRYHRRSRPLGDCVGPGGIRHAPRTN